MRSVHAAHPLLIDARIVAGKRRDMRMEAASIPALSDAIFKCGHFPEASVLLRISAAQIVGLARTTPLLASVSLRILNDACPYRKIPCTASSLDASRRNSSSWASLKRTENEFASKIILNGPAKAINAMFLV